MTSTMMTTTKSVPSDLKSLPQTKRLDIYEKLMGELLLAKVPTTKHPVKVTQMFGNPRFGITPSVLKRGLGTQFGLVLSDSDIEALFRRLDRDRSGCVSVQEFLSRIQPPEYTSEPWNVTRDRADEARLRAQAGKYRPTISELPPSLKGSSWSSDKVIAKLRQKVEQRARCPGLSQNREAYAMFGAPKRGISPEGFKRSMTRLGFVLEDSQLMDVFKRLDTDGSGVITFADFVSGVLSDDYSGKTWTAIRDEEMTRTKKASHGKSKHDVSSLPRSLEPSRKELGLEFIENQLRDKVQSKSRSGPGASRELFRLFGNTSKVISRPTFIATCRRLGVAGTDKDLRRLFDKYDVDGAGMLDFPEFARMVLPSDVSQKIWVVRRDEEEEAKRIQKKIDGYDPTLRSMPRTLDASDSLSVSEVEDRIVERINQRAREPAAQFREAYRLFGNPEDGISYEHLKDRLCRMGLVLAESDLREMFRKYDRDSSGLINYHELAKGLFSKNDGSTAWNMARDGEIARRKREMRELTMRDAPHLQPKYRPPGGAAPFSARTSELSTGRSSYLSGTARSTTRSTTRSTGRFAGATPGTGRSRGSARSSTRSLTSSRSHTAVRTGPAIGIVGSSALTSSARSLLSRP